MNVCDGFKKTWLNVRENLMNETKILSRNSNRLLHFSSRPTHTQSASNAQNTL
jgi:hypothetical protein